MYDLGEDIEKIDGEIEREAQGCLQSFSKLGCTADKCGLLGGVPETLRLHKKNEVEWPYQGLPGESRLHGSVLSDAGGHLAHPCGGHLYRAQNGAKIREMICMIPSIYGKTYKFLESIQLPCYH